MHLIIVGAGTVGDSLTGLAVKLGHQVALIEEDETRAEAAAERHDARVLHAAIAEADIMTEAGAAEADALIATTGDDSTNLMAMVLGQEWEIDTLISTVGHKHHRRLFDRLGVRTLVDPEVLVAQHLLDLVLHPSAEEVTTLSRRAQIYELRLSGDSPLVGRSLSELDQESLLPQGTYIVSIQREDRDFFPRESSRLRNGDQLVVFSRAPLDDRAIQRFTGPGET